MSDSNEPAEPGTRRGAGARVLRAAGYGLFLLSCLVFADWVCYLRWRHATDRPPPKRPFLKETRHVPPGTLQRLGWIEANQETSFVRFDKEKKPGVIRIGCLGDSFTYGTEVGPAEDFPTLLQGLFRERGYANVEVINFSSGWYGFQQVYILWDEVARGFGLDYVVLGPMAFFPGRDTTFDHSSPVTANFHHARRVLDGAGLRLLDVVGDTFESRTAAYRSFIPRWRYLRYDRRPPAFLACLLPSGREMRNPFYYQRDPEAEALNIYERLLNGMADSGAQVVLGHYMPSIVEVGGRVRRSNFYSTRLEEVHRFPYRALKNHNGPAGNRLLAEQFFALLTGKRELRLPLIRFDPLGPGAASSARPPRRGLDAYERVGVDTGEGKPWRFVEVMQGTRVRYVPEDYFRSRGLASLILLKLPEHQLPQAILYPVAGDLEEGMPLTVRPRGGPRAGTEVLLGRVSLLHPGLNVGVVDLGEVFRNDYPCFNNEAAVALVRDPFRKAFPGDVFLGGRRLLWAAPPDGSGRVTLQPYVRRFLQVYPPAALLGGRGPKAAGTLSLRLTEKAGRGFRLPLSRWRRTDRDFEDGFSGTEGPKPIRRRK